MTSVRTDPDATAADRAQTVLDWTRINAKALTAGAVIVIVAAAGYWFYMRSKQIQAANAEKALMQAKQSLGAGNLALAQSDLQSVYSRYESTPAGVQAAMLLAQVDFDSGKYQDGITVIDKALGNGAAAGVESSLRSLQGDGYAQMGKSADAGKAYEKAAEATGYPNEKAFQLAKAARAYQVAGDTAKAKQIWTNLLNDPNAQGMSAEARVRLGEMTTQVAKR
jgi:predicted negative regulator of RcsB-dependent stress response